MPGRKAGLQQCELANELGTLGIRRPPGVPPCRRWGPGLLDLGSWTQAAAGWFRRRRASDRPTRAGTGVGHRACEPSKAGLTAPLQPAPPQLGRSAPPPEPALAATWPSHPRHARLQLVQGRCGINFPEATSPPEEVDRQLCIYTLSAASGCAPRGPVRRTADSCGTLAFEEGFALPRDPERCRQD